MARKGTVIWHVVKSKVKDVITARETDEVLEEHYHLALRGDGKVIERKVVELLNFTNDDSRRVDFGWKLVKGELKLGMDSPETAHRVLSAAGFRIIV